jgi:nuclear transport factor 2 (NTF2) superfamily protein
MNDKPPVPPFTRETAIQKARMAEDAWNSKDPERVSLAYTEDSYWRNRSEFIQGRQEIVAFLKRKWAKENGYRLIKEVWAWHDNRKLGIRRKRPDASSRSQYKRRANC